MPQPKSGKSASSRKSTAASSRSGSKSKSTTARTGTKATGRTASRTTGAKAKGRTTSRSTGAKATGRSTSRTTGAKAKGRTTGRKASGTRGSGSTTRKSSPRARSTTPRSRASAKPAPSASSQARAEDLVATLALLRDHLRRGVVLTAERLQETLDDTVRRGRITRDDAEDLLQSLVTIGRKQTEDVLDDLEQLFGRGQGGMAQAARDAGRRAAEQARRYQGADRFLQEVDRARRAAGIGPAFPITSYDNLSATQVAARLDQLTDPQLRKVRDYERRHQNRTSVLDAIERRLQQS